VKIEGNPEGIDALKAMHGKNPGFMRSLLEDARSTTDHATTFRDEQGRRWQLRLDPNDGKLTVEKAPPRGSVPPPPVIRPSSRPPGPDD
jgi:hypothetical protein